MLQPIRTWVSLARSLGLVRRKSRKRPQPRPIAIETLEQRQLLAGDFRIVPVVVYEADQNVTAVVTVHRDGDTTGTATVDFRTLDGSALAGSDYTATSGTLSFTPGQASQTLSVTILPGSNAAAEALESFTVQLSNPQNATITSGKGEAAVAIKDNDAILVTGPDAGAEPRVKVYNATTGALKYSFLAYAQAYTGGVRVAAGDVNGDGVPDVVTATGAATPHIRIFNGATSTQDNPVEIRGFFAFESQYTGGVHLAVADVNGDGQADIITASQTGGTPEVRVYHGTVNALIGAPFNPFSGLAGYNGSATLAAANVDGDSNGRAEIVAGTQGGPAEVRVFQFNSSGNSYQQLGATIVPYAGFGGQIFVGAGDIDADGKADIITGAGPGAGPHVRVLRASDQAELASFYAYDPAFTGGVRVAGGDADGDGVSELITGPGPGGGPHLRLFNPHNTTTPLREFFAYEGSFTGGMFVGGETEDARDSIRVLDDDDHPGTVVFNPAWSEATHGGFLRDFRYLPAGFGTKTATWTYSGLSPGLYRVSATWHGDVSRPTNAPYTISSGSLLAATVVNQEFAPFHLSDAGVLWDDLGGRGTTYVITGSTLSVQLSDAGDQWVSADAVRIERLHGFSAPLVATTPSPLSYLENSGEAAIDLGLTVIDADSAALANATVTISSGYVASEDSLTWTNQPGITGNYNPATGTLSVTGMASLAAYQALLRSVRYANSSENPNTAPRLVSFSVHDGIAGSNTAARTINVVSVNDQPSFTAANPPVVNEDSGPHSLTNWVTAFNPGAPAEAGQTAAYLVSNVSNPALFSAPPSVSSQGTLTYALAGNAFGISTFAVVVQDSGGAANGGIDTSTPQTFTLTVNGVNDAPSFQRGPDVFVDENAGPQSIPGWATNISAGPANESGQTLNFLVTGDNPSLFAVAPAISANGTLTFTLAGDAGATQLTVRLQDSGGTANGGQNLSPPQTFSLTANNANALPTISQIFDQAIDENESVDPPIAFTIGDLETPAGQLQVTASSSNTTLVPLSAIFLDGSGANRTVTVTPAPDQTGSATITLTVTDGNGGSAAESFTLTVNGVNTPPVAFSQQVGTTRNEAVSFTLAGNDGDPEFTQTLTFFVGTGPANGNLSFNATTGAATYTPDSTPAPGYFGSDSFTFYVRDDSSIDGTPLDSPPATVSIEVAEDNHAPQLADLDDPTVIEGETLALRILAADEDVGDALTYSLVWLGTDGQPIAPPGRASFDYETGILLWAPQEEDGPGEFSVQIGVSDNGATSLADSDVITITVEEQNLLPLVSWSGWGLITPVKAVYVGFGSDEDPPQTVEFTAFASDNDLPAQTLVFTLEDAPDGAEIDPQTGLFTWEVTPDDAVATYDITVVIDDGVATNTVVVPVNIWHTGREPVSFAPVANPNDYSEVHGQPITGNVLTNDSWFSPGGVLPEIEISTDPEHGTATIDTNGHLTYTPTGQPFSGPDKLEYEITDHYPGDVSASHSTTVEFHMTNAKPSALGRTYNVKQDNELNVSVLDGLLKDNGTDGEGDATTIAAIVIPPAYAAASPGSPTARSTTRPRPASAGSTPSPTRSTSWPRWTSISRTSTRLSTTTSVSTRSCA